MDPVSAMLLFVLFQAAEKAIGYAGGKIADSMTKPVWEALEEKARWISGKSDTTKRWEAFSQAFAEAREKLETDGRHWDVAKQVAKVLEQYDVTDPSDRDWLNDLSMQLEKASLVSEKPDQFLLVELFSRALSGQTTQVSRAELSETISDFVSIFQDALFAQPAYQEAMFKRAQWQALRQPRYDTRERYIAQVIEHNESLDFVGIPELKDRQALRIEDVFISLQTQVEETKRSKRLDEIYDLNEAMAQEELKERNIRAHLGEIKQKISRRLTVNQALTEDQKIAILGDPGSGKTTLLKYIVLAFAENKMDKLGLNETRLPIFIRLYDYVAKREACGKDGFSFTDYLNKYCTDNLQLHLPPDFFEAALERGECCVCFDGLDELGAAGLRREITSAVSAMANRYPRNRFIVTSRIVGYDEAPLNRRDFDHHTIQPLADDDIKLFVEKWYKAREHDAVARRERAEHLIKTIMGEERIKSLASNPLMLTIIALVHRIEAELPHERVKLYDKCVTTLVETWDKVRGIHTDPRRRLLEKLAYWMHSQPGEKGRTREVREGNLRLQLTQFLASDPKRQRDEEQILHEVDNFIALIKTRSGLLVERGEDVYTFSHLTFQEYLAACDIVTRFAHSTEAIWNEIQPKLHDSHWREVILLLLGSLNRFEEHNSILVRKIYESSDQYEPVLHRYLLLSARALADHVEVDSGLHNKIVDDILGLASLNWLSDWEVFDVIDELKYDPRIVAGLLALAEDEKVNASTRGFVAQVLGEAGRIIEAGRLLLALAEDEIKNAEVCFNAAKVLGQLGYVDEASKLFLVLVGDEKADIQVRLSAVWELRKLEHLEEAVFNELSALAGDEKLDIRVRMEAMMALGRLGRTDEASKLLKALVEDEKVSVKARIRGAQELGQLGRVDEATKLLLLWLGDEKLNSEMRSEVAKGLKQLGRADEAGRLLLALMEDEKVDNGIRWDAAWTLKFLQHLDEIFLNKLLAMAGDKNVDAGVRCLVAELLGDYGRVSEAGKLLIALVGNKKVNVATRLNAARALGKVGLVGEAGRLLIALVEDEEVNSRMRRYAINELGGLKWIEESILNRLFKLMENEKVDFLARYEAAKVLEQYGHVDKTVLNVLLAVAEDEKMDVAERLSTMEVLGNLGLADEMGRLLVTLAGDKKVDATARSVATQALGRLGCVEPVVLTSLDMLARDEKTESHVRNNAISALGELGHANEAGRLFLALAGDEKVNVEERCNAVQALGQLGRVDEDVLNGLLTLVGDRKVDAWVRRDATQALKQLLG